jgi:hypothetical protein
MLGRVRSRLTYANVMSTIAVFGVLAGGGAWAASKIGSGDIERNAVRSKHIKNQQVKPGDVKDDSLTGAELADDSLSGADVAAGSLTGADVADDSLTAADIDEATLGQAVSAVAIGEEDIALTGFGTTVVETELEVPVRSTLMASASLFLGGNGGDDDQPRCQIFDTVPGGGSEGLSSILRQTIPDTAGDEATMALNGGTDAEPGVHTIAVRCDVATGGTASVLNSHLIVWTIPG